MPNSRLFCIYLRKHEVLYKTTVLSSAGTESLVIQAFLMEYGVGAEHATRELGVSFRGLTSFN